jgi:serine/threonine-protein kinase HipA
MIAYGKLNSANIYLRDELVGTLVKDAKGFIFTYTGEWKARSIGGVAISLPTEHSPYREKELHAFFDNLIPEGWLLSHAEKVHKIDKENRFALLLATGRSPIGAVKVIALNEAGTEIRKDESLIKIEDETKDYELKFETLNGHCPYCLKKMTKIQLSKTQAHVKCTRDMWGTAKKLKVKLSGEDPLESFRQTIYGASISGAQRKGLFKLEGSILEAGYEDAKYILKPQSNYDQLPENEHLTMAIAKQVGFDIPPFTIFEIKGFGKVFAIKRFDFFKGNQLRMEDAAQVVQEPSANKYDKSNESVAKMINYVSLTSKVDLEDFWKRMVFSYLIGNSDMHLKNWSFLELNSMNGQFKLSPCYDFLNTRLPIPKETIDIGLTICGKSNNLRWSYFKKFAQSFEISEDTISEVYDKLSMWRNIGIDSTNISFLSDKSKDKYIEIVNLRFEILTTT